MTRRLALAAAGLLLPVLAAAQGAPRTRTTYEDLQMFSGVLNQLRVNHPDSLDSHKLIVGAIRGMLAEMDPHSYLIETRPALAGREKQLMEGKLVTTSIAFRYVGGAPVVAGSSGSGARTLAALDVLPGDELVTLDGKPVEAKSEEELELELAGDKGSRLQLGLRRLRADGSTADLTREIVREKRGGERAVPAAFMLDAQTGYLRLATFAVEKADDAAKKALGQLEGKGMKRLVLDLRDNGGGLVKDASDFAALFLPEGAVVYSSEGRKKDVNDTVKVSRSWFSSARSYPIVVLQNAGTASAAELVSGALQDHERARIVGRPSFGKALMMFPFLLPDGSLLMMVAGHVKTPCGRVVQREYRGISTREYYRAAAAARDTVGRPSCKTSGGRTVYGGGGIYPDLVVPEPRERPVWQRRASEALLPVRWLAGWIEAHPAPARAPEVEAATPLPPAAIADFRAFAAREGMPLPDGADVDQRLAAWLQPLVADARGGEEAYWRAVIRQDTDVQTAMGAFVVR